jgi:hypothetical protein
MLVWKLQTKFQFRNSILISIGKENLERRLSAIYKKDYVLQHDQSNDIFTTTLQLPF